MIYISYYITKKGIVSKNIMILPLNTKMPWNDKKPGQI
jgi:hypothetical protein